MLKLRKRSEGATRNAGGSKRRLAPQPRVEYLEARDLLAFSSLVFPGGDGNLLYQPDANANRIEDFSNVGYQGGTVPLPDTPGGISVPIQVVLQPTDGDQGARIQAAINQVSQLPLDENGYRGAVLLQAGEYPIEGQLRISASGVVLLGEGTDAASGTRLRATGTSQRTLIQIQGSGSRQRVGPIRNLIDKYVPVGARSFRVDNVDGLNVGDTIVVHRPSTANWIHDIGMDRLTNPWQPNSKNLDWDRVITRIEGNTVTIDAPLTNALEQRYGGGTLYQYTWPGRLENVGVENLYGKSDFASSTDENHSWRFIAFRNAENAWVHDVVSQYFAYACVELDGGAKWITVQDSQCLDPISVVTGGRRYSFDINGAQLSLFRNDFTRGGRHDFTIQSTVAGPNAFVDCRSQGALNESGPHQRWSTGTLFDDVETHGNSSSGLNIRNALNEGTGHGWQGANYVFWNSTADRMNISSPPTANNWVIGARAGRFAGNAVYDSRGTPVEPRSLYYQQLAERQAFPGLDKREYWLGDIDNFSPGDPEDSPYVDPDWLGTVQRAAGSHPVVGFDDLRPDHKWIPFTFTFDLAPGEQVVSASLSLAMRGTGSVREDDRIYLGSLDNSYRFDDLGWTPIPTTGTSPRVFDLSGQTDLLQGGQLNVAVQDDVAINWAVLNIQVAPSGANAPTSLIHSLGAMLSGPVEAGQNDGAMRPRKHATAQRENYELEATPAPSQSVPIYTPLEDQVPIPATHAAASEETVIQVLAQMANAHEVAADLLFTDLWRANTFASF